jgi:hypothetical protein
MLKGLLSVVVLTLSLGAFAQDQLQVVSGGSGAPAGNCYNYHGNRCVPASSIGCANGEALVSQCSGFTSPGGKPKHRELELRQYIQKYSLERDLIKIH